MQHLKVLDAKHKKTPQTVKRLKVFYGWSKINKIQKREAIAVAFENEELAGDENRRSGKSLRKTMTVCYGNPPYARTLTNTNKLLGMDDTVIGVKTGFTDAAGRCLVSAARRQNRTLICVTLNDRNDWSDHEALYDYGFAGAEDYTPPLPEQLTVQVEGGDAQAVSGYVREAPQLTAPVQRGEQIGEIIWRCGAVEIERAPVYAAENVQLTKKTASGSWLVRTISRIRCMFK